MHPDTLAALRAAIRAEIAADPTARGYAGKTPAEIAALMNAPIVTVPAAQYRDVLVSDVRGYLEARLLLVRIEDWIADPATPPGDARDAARTLLRVTGNSNITYFSTGNPGGRANVLGLFALLVSAGAGGLTQAHYDDLAAMTVASQPPQTAPAQWLAVIEGISGVDGLPGPPNAATEALVQEAINGGR
jgi:hypothetical protein